MIRNSRRLGAILIFTPDRAYVYLRVLYTIYEVEDKEAQGVRGLALVILA